MKIIHRISIASSAEVVRELAAFGIRVSSSGLVTFEYDESGIDWPEVKGWISRRNAVDVSRTDFSSLEVASADWLRVIPEWHCGYPQPDEEKFGYRQQTYDLSMFCEQCGVGLSQKAAFKMKGEPKWGRRNAMQLNWVLDEFFIKVGPLLDVFEHFGVRSRPVLDTSGVQLETVVQLDVNETVEIDANELSYEACPRCGIKKYHPISRGMLPKLLSKPDGNMVRTRQYFGSGAQAAAAVAISQRLSRALLEAGVNGIYFQPISK